MQCTDTFFTDRLYLAYSYAKQWHAGMFVPINVSAVTYLQGISDKVLRHDGCQDAAVAACLYKGIVPNTSYMSLINPATAEAGDGSNTMDSVSYFFGRRVGSIVSQLNSAPAKKPTAEAQSAQMAAWAHFLSRQAQVVLLAEKWQNFENRRQEISNGVVAHRLLSYCTSRFRVIDSIWQSCPPLAKEAKSVGYQLMDQAHAYLREKKREQRGHE